MTIALRAAEPRDGDAIAAVFGAARDRALPYLPVLHSAAEDRGFFGAVIARGGTTVATDDGRVVAFIAVGDARVEHLYVDPAHWRRGIGSALLGHAQECCPDGLDLWVFARNAVAIGFYERHGFAIAQRTDGSGNEEGEPDVRMVWPGA
jgi:ribosomal protein S18 acetylase RimI-like enzyme